MKAVTSLLRSFLCITGSVSTVSLSSPIITSRQANSVIGATVFLRRAFHSSAVLDGWVYISGGEFSYSSGGGTIEYHKRFNIDKLVLGMDRHIVETTLDVQAQESTESKEWQNSVSSPQGLWSFTPDGLGGGSWQSLNETVDPIFTNRPRAFKGQVYSTRGTGFFLGVHKTPVEGLVAYDFSTKQVTNTMISGQGGPDPLTPFTNVRIYDLESKKLHEQQTIGNVPEPWKDFCLAGAGSSNRTHEIIVYAGWAGKLGSSAIPYDQAFVLTLPGFHWVEADFAALHPRHGLTCHAVGGGQILTIGGVDMTQSSSSSKNDSSSGGSYADVFNTPNPFAQGLAIFDLGSLSWKSLYTPPSSSKKNTGRKPEDGFDSPSLKSIFAAENFGSPSSASGGVGPSNSSGRYPNTGAIVGGVVGGVAVVVLVVVIAICCRRARKR
ncbi:hypothetical protein B0H63DRAFT_525561 [Podospora didyma]|uniref:Peptidase A1 domain-containing protein n=1 Tax=Podospora didyma TaxID=330526 RepID=A0AAE0KL94_9PEZI|nr:hypothetical protein B0H63DRAFT_525561 [Podospora didyma]